ncbi:MAG: winged helix-turn-helix transcriptional regulator [Candidatus Aegiribacteria sp.]|nr:winged helix-turn-helix transcriptional regulator [Candidatus Aegiribacteria sp.]
MSDLDRFESQAEILKAMAHPVRLMILEELVKNPRCVSAINEILEVRQSNISQHLTILRNAGIVGSQKDGAHRCYFLIRPGLVEAAFNALNMNWPEADINDVRKKFKRALKNRLQQEQSS